MKTHVCSCNTFGKVITSDNVRSRECVWWKCTSSEIICKPEGNGCWLLWVILGKELQAKQLRKESACFYARMKENRKFRHLGSCISRKSNCFLTLTIRDKIQKDFKIESTYGNTNKIRLRIWPSLFQLQPFSGIKYLRAKIKLRTWGPAIFSTG